jgi:hypothetical protein
MFLSKYDGLLSKQDKGWAKSVNNGNKGRKLAEAAGENNEGRVFWLLTAHEITPQEKCAAVSEAVDKNAGSVLPALLIHLDGKLSPHGIEDKAILRSLVKRAADRGRYDAWDALYEYNAQLIEHYRPYANAMPMVPYLTLPEFGAASAGGVHAVDRLFHRVTTEPVNAKGLFPAVLDAIVRLPDNKHEDAVDRNNFLPLISVLKWKDYFTDAQQGLDQALVAAAHLSDPKTGDTEKSTLLLNHKADPLHDGAAALVAAAMKDHDPLRDLLIGRGADVRRLDPAAIRAPKLLVAKLAELAEEAELDKTQGPAPRPLRMQVTTQDEKGATLKLVFNFEGEKISTVTSENGQAVRMDLAQDLQGVPGADAVQRAGGQIVRAARATGLLARRKLPGTGS